MQWNTLLRPAGSPFVALRRDFERQLGQENVPSYAGMTVLEYDDRYTVSVDLPGLSESEIAVSIQDGVLVVEGERGSFGAEGAREVFNDRTIGKFRRMLKIREGVDVSSIEADLQQGVLTLTLKRSVEVGRKIVVRAKGAAAPAAPAATTTPSEPQVGPRDFE
jgi:HSP20 family protein